MMTKNQTIFETQVLEVGAETPDFKSIGMAILFGNEAPNALRPSCFIINVKPLQDTIEPGMSLIIDNQTYQITAVGNEVQTNLGRLGHTAVCFTGETTAKLPGSLYVEQADYPDIKVGSQIKIVKA